MRTQRLLFFVVTVLVIGGMLPTPAFSANAIVESFPTWQRAAVTLNSAGNLYYPSNRANLIQESRIDVLAFTKNSKSANGVRYSSMLVTATYTNRHGSFSLMEKYAGVKWAARRVADPGQRVVSRQLIKMRESGTKVKSTIYANCAVPEIDSAIEQQKSCSRADVKLFGGLLVMKIPGETSIIIESSGLSFQQLIAVSRGLKVLEVNG